ncbi:alpha/beta hydrolase [Candidatus Saccharibacteria bacterium]|nr:alpha/beta hydrolase [Candidatus Saccharibacteria bacterium]
MMQHKLTLFKTYDKCANAKPKLTVVLIHGIASDSSTYNTALKHFEKMSDLKDVRFVTFDLLGSGKSLKSDELNYDYNDQLSALKKSIKQLKSKTPLILVGHSLGTFIVTRFTNKYPKSVSRLILISPPIYTKADFANPAFAVGIDAFKKAVSVKNRDILKEKSFINSMDKIVLDKNNYDVLAQIKVPTTLIYSKEDQLIAPYNVPGIIRKNSSLHAIGTHGRHGVTEDKFKELAKILVKEVNA